MSLYEHVILSRPDISQEQCEENIGNFARKIENMGGSVGRVEYWGLRNLAYQVKKNRKAHYSMMQINAAPQALHELERQHRINDDVIRYMSIRVDNFNEDISPVLARREERKKKDVR